MTIQIIKHKTYLEIVDKKMEQAVKALSKSPVITYREIIALQIMGFEIQDIT